MRDSCLKISSQGRKRASTNGEQLPQKAVKKAVLFILSFLFLQTQSNIYRFRQLIHFSRKRAVDVHFLVTTGSPSFFMFRPKEICNVYLVQT
ncbi:hypothetical protein QUF49_17290 [Fictibacillus sp. b24]|uniref:hypothetical protein n=1 Tax=Fictibacillus sp. b24 TaxID=3055863 RepID=UPI0025A00567|nr:hypothetical protein [Fictibacillus sp. b24]MDM5317768.1 hypothetical protein [Fictibacillus sp. b24]